ncbi:MULTISPECIES: hypothetical protein [Pasteurellaceae]|uniref:Uncharacterized protein n=1 Tax=Pasteurella atlantica TaxID=2827233 RepID=A0AAW8CR45_9PAST|nr:hypothetical protein [Pasteurella atlantica]MBR0573274.1 hypothetical protein [Pasteurella atlantica]MDP8039110.1 hypothetical protein [Pasteurella atlantica]MDP8041291.1 hypothetical protein [Pasteurella atlantica]MDP8043428.1 hypothetical protein [Pasteurella atlantica]MDP8045514.1 hypothetical protein [Pasteurella atlantica]
MANWFFSKIALCEQFGISRSTDNKHRCYFPTVMDNFSRYMLLCQTPVTSQFIYFELIFDYI